MRVRVEVDLASVSAAHRAAYERRILEGDMPVGDQPFSTPAGRREIIDMMVYPERFPAHYRVLADATGHLWAERADGPRDPFPRLTGPDPSPTTWEVIAPDGRWLGSVTLPERFDPLEIGEAHVAGVHADALGIERVRVYALTR